MHDYIIVGAGLAGISFAETAINNNKSVVVFENESQNSSRIAAGLYNPVILKRFSEVAHAKEQLELGAFFYQNMEKKVGINLDTKLPILRKFFSIEEQNNWFAAADKIKLAPFLSLDLLYKNYEFIKAPFGYGVVLQTGYVATGTLLEVYHDYLNKNHLLIRETFDYSLLHQFDDHVSYKNIRARHLVFAEGFGIHANPFFNYLPLDGTKGELILIKAPKLNLVEIINTSVFILPLGNDLYKVGATYNWKDKTNIPTPEGKSELIDRLREIITCDFEVILHEAGIRPTVRDRRPLVGTHFENHRLHILNGLGTRGVMIGPWVAKELFDHIEHQIPLSKENNIQRFKE